MQLLDIRNLTIELDTPHGRFVALEKFSLRMTEGEIHGLVGESGSGKSLLAKAILGITDRRTHVRADRLNWNGKNMLSMSSRERRQLMSNEIAMIFQEPAACLDPSAKIGSQLIESMPNNTEVSWWKRGKQRRKLAIQLLHKVGVKQHQPLLEAYPWELTESEAHKVMLAMALARKPKLIVADEPTTGLETATQAQIFRMLEKLNQLHNVAILFISHDLQAVGRWSDKVTVLYCGHMMESGVAKKVLGNFRHPYTQALLESSLSNTFHLPHKAELPALRGAVPLLQHLPVGCRLGPRCPRAQKECVKAPVIRSVNGHAYRCHFPIEQKDKA
ncbi:oligopeptide/dipeptide ABC transporter ATP-binding protein [Ferrimonas lipolytica]|uniref:ATP-binding cassette domain-containing protein n=1 Tax=Ferrimonas lipolytica TaxID=2724191 RepID=A0A6H1U9U9_9GAMM|nr:oligopeptide/dipeptide ABC transporter ATP-binding protein [Ferrimonas lipolytica]QIZ75821.1 ATP-binding cassette domain-containing protein [Ferrimonas lipolytica]